MALYPAEIAQNQAETPHLRRIALTVPPFVTASHRRAGQYIQLQIGQHIGFFALSGAPGRPVELLVKPGGGAAAALAALCAGAPVETSAVQGKGYPLEECAGRDLVALAAGSGIAPIRALIDTVRADRTRYRKVTVFYGQRHADEFAFASEHEHWARDGIELIRVLSAPSAQWAGPVGHVQDALLQMAPPLDEAAAFLCGMKPMVAAATEALVRCGLAKERVHLNF